MLRHQLIIKKDLPIYIWKSILIITFLVFCLASVTVTAEIKLPRKAQKALFEAQKNLQTKEYGKAAEYLNSYLIKYPDNPPVLIFQLLGTIWYQGEDLEKSYSAFERGLQHDPTNDSMCLNMAVISYEMEKYERAGQLFETVYELSPPPKDVSFLYKAATAYFQTEKYTLSIKTLNRLLSLQKEVEPAWLKLLVYSYFETEEWEKAKKTILKYLSDNPADSEFWKMLARIQLDQNNYEKGANALEIYYLLANPSDKAWLELADIYFYLNAPLKAVRCINHITDISSPEILDKIAQAYSAAHRYEKAVLTLTKALQLEATAKRHFTLGKLHYDNSQFQKALESFQHCLALDPHQTEALLLSGYSELGLKQWKKAHQTFEIAAKESSISDQAVYGIEITSSLITAKKEATINSESY